MRIARMTGLMGALAVLTGLAGCRGAKCDNVAFYGLPSPDSTHIAFIFHRTCTPPGGITTQVSIMPFHESLREEAGNVLSVAGEQPVKVSWRGAQTLMVTGFKDPTYQRTQPLDSIAVQYEGSGR